jgi:hypothetical protein
MILEEKGEREEEDFEGFGLSTGGESKIESGVEGGESGEGGGDWNLEMAWI